MSATTVSSNMRLRRRDGLCLATAVIFHNLLLLIPLRQAPVPAEDSRAISVTLQAPREIGDTGGEEARQRPVIDALPEIASTA